MATQEIMKLSVHHKMKTKNLGPLQVFHPPVLMGELKKGGGGLISYLADNNGNE